MIFTAVCRQFFLWVVGLQYPKNDYFFYPFPWSWYCTALLLWVLSPFIQCTSNFAARLYIFDLFHKFNAAQNIRCMFGLEQALYLIWILWKSLEFHLSLKHDKRMDSFMFIGFMHLAFVQTLYSSIYSFHPSIRPCVYSFISSIPNLFMHPVNQYVRPPSLFEVSIFKAWHPEITDIQSCRASLCSWKNFEKIVERCFILFFFLCVHWN